MFIAKKLRGFLQLIALSALTFSLAAPPALAQAPDTRSGTITSVWASGAENYGFRIYLSNNGVDTLSGCAGDFAYMNASYSNYNVAVATLLSDYHRSRPVLLTVVVDANHFCQIVEVSG